MGSVFGGLSGLMGASELVSRLKALAAGLVQDLSESQGNDGVALLSTSTWFGACFPY